MTIGNAIKLIRTARKIRQRELAARLGVSANYMSMLEAARREPSISTLKKLAQELHVPAGLFLLWAEPTGKKIRPSQVRRLRELLVRVQAIYLEEESDSKEEIATT